MVTLRERPEFREGNQKLFEYLGKTYVEVELEESIRRHVELIEGEPSRLTLGCRREKIQVLDQAPQTAERQLATRGEVLKQLNRAGRSPFCLQTLTAQVRGDLFFPVQMLNELCRAGFKELEKRLTGVALAIGHPSADPTSQPAPIQNIALRPRSILTQTATPQSQPVFTAFLGGTARLSSVLAYDGISAVYLDANGFGPDQWRDIADRCHSRGKQYQLVLPQMFRSHAQRYLGDSHRLPRRAGFNGMLTGALEETVWLKDLMEQGIPGFPLPFGVGAPVYGWNSWSARVLVSVGTPMLTMSWELNSRGLEPVLTSCHSPGLTSGPIICGNTPMMVPAQCITSTVKGCTHKWGTLMMKDGTGTVLPIKSHCPLYYNIIYNPAPLSLLDNEKLVRRLMAEYLRLQFTVEGIEQTGKVLDAFIGSLVYNRDMDVPLRDSTREHFRRGVE